MNDKIFKLYSPARGKIYSVDEALDLIGELVFSSIKIATHTPFYSSNRSRSISILRLLVLWPLLDVHAVRDSGNRLCNCNGKMWPRIGHVPEGNSFQCLCLWHRPQFALVRLPNRPIRTQTNDLRECGALHHFLCNLCTGSGILASRRFQTALWNEVEKSGVPFIKTCLYHFFSSSVLLPVLPEPLRTWASSFRCKRGQLRSCTEVPWGQ